MAQLNATIEAATYEEALAKAASILDTSADNFELAQSGQGIFVAAVKNVDAEILLEISDDKMSAMIQSVSVHRGAGKPMDMQTIFDTFERLSIVVPPLERVLEKIEKAVLGSEDVKGIVVAKGIPPKNGTDGVVDLLVRTEVSAGRADEQNRIDYHERGFVATVSDGDLLGHITQPAAGEVGVDIFGNAVAQQCGKEPIFEAGDNVQITEKGEIRAQKAGMIQYVHSVLGVTEVFEHKGNVDFHTGNIHMDTGSISIRGTVLPGFEVDASGNVVITETIKEAKICSGGDIELNQGAIDSSLHARGAIFVRYAQNSTLVCAGKLVVSANLHNCQVNAGDGVTVVAGKGIVRGGHIHCGTIFEAKQVGSLSEVETLIEVGARSEQENDLVIERASVTEAIVEINRFLGCENSELDLSGKSDNERKAIEKVLETLKMLERKKTEISSLIFSKTKERLSSCHYQAIIHNIVHPGTHISIAGHDFWVKQPLRRCCFVYSPQRDKVVVESL